MFYAFLQMDGTPVHLLTQHKHNGARSASAQTTGWRKADTWRLPRTKIGACKEIPKWQTWASLWPHSNLLWKQRLKKKKKTMSSCCYDQECFKTIRSLQFQAELLRKNWQQSKRYAHCVNKQNARTRTTWIRLYGAIYAYMNLFCKIH